MLLRTALLLPLAATLACAGWNNRPLSSEGDEGAGGSDDGSAGVTVTSANDSNWSASDAGDVETGDPTSSTDSTDTTSGFVPDGGGNSCGEDCDIWEESPCEPGWKCTAVACEIGSNAWDSHLCREIQGTAQLGDDCFYTDGSGVSGNDTCAEGHICWNADPDTQIGTCLAYCTGSPESPYCAPGSSCAISGSGVLPICLPGCDPLAQDCESSNEQCLPDPSGQGYICALDASGDMSPYGTPCNYINVCNPGLMCVDAAGVPEPGCEAAAGCCSPYCSIRSGVPCPGEGQTCEPVFDPQPPGYEDVGVCRIAS